MNPLPWQGATPYQDSGCPPTLSLTDQIGDPLVGLELGPGCRHGCRSGKAGLGTAERTDEGSEEQRGSGQS